MTLKLFSRHNRWWKSHNSNCFDIASSSASGASIAVAISAMLLSSSTAEAQDSDRMLFHSQDGFEVRGHLQLGLNAVAEDNLFWGLAATTAPGSGFDPDTEWLESYIKPGVSFRRTFDSGYVLYGKLSAVASYTLGTDAFDTGDTGDATLEEAYLGLRYPIGERVSLDLSLGARELKLGTGMLIANGATSGFERGALKFGPRKAWENVAVGRLSYDNFVGTLFYLDPNELPSTDGGNKLAGFDVRMDSSEGGYLGATFVSVLDSNSPYPQIGGPPVTGAREGTNTFNAYAKTDPLSGTLQNWTFSTDLAYQWNDDFNLSAYAGRVTAEYKFADLPWSPSLTFGYQTFSGDDPATSTYERYDPLYYEGSPSAWATGSKSASTFINSNVNAVSLALRLKPTQQDTWTLRYAHIRANELNSPIQFGQATRLDASGNVITGVTDPHLADDVFLEYSRIINRNTFLTAGASVSFPGTGINDVVGRSLDPWTGGFINVVLNF